MKTIFSFTLLCFLFFSGRAQDVTSDSIIHVLDTLKITHHNHGTVFKLVSSILPSDFQKGISKLKEGLTIAESDHDTTNELNYCLMLGRSFASNNQFETGISYLKEAAVKSGKYAIPAAEAQSFGNIAVLFSYLGMTDSALFYNQLGISIAGKINQNTFLYHLYNDRGEFLKTKGKFSESLDSYRKSLNYAGLAKDSSGMILPYLNMASVLRQLGQYDSSKYYCEKGIALAETFKYNQGLGVGFSNMSSIYFELDDFPTAINYQLKALRVKESTYGEPISNIANILSDISTLYTAIGDYQNALVYYGKSLALNEKAKIPALQAILLNQYGIIKLKQDSARIALPSIEKAIELEKKLGDKVQISNFLNSSVECYLALGQPDSAILFCKQALAFSAEDQNRNMIANNLNLMGDAYFQIGNLDSALVYQLKSYENARSVKSLKIAGRSSSSLAAIYSKKGNFEKAYYYHTVFKNIADSIFNNENARKVAALESKYESEKTEQENLLVNERKDRMIELLNKDRAIDNLKLLEQKALNDEQRALALNRLSQIDLLNKSNEIEKLNAQKSEEAFNHQKSITESEKAKVAMLNQIKNYQATELINSNKIKNYSLIALVAVFAFSLLLYFQYRNAIRLKRFQEEKTLLINAEKEKAEFQRLRAEESERFKSRFLANMSHEIRTPMNAVLGMTNLLLQSELNEQQSKYLAAINKSAKNLLVIINDILDLSKIEAGKMEVENIHFRFQDGLDLVYNTLRFKAEEKGLKFEIATDENIPPVLVGDPVRLNQVLINIAGNAIKFTEKGKVSIQVEILKNQNDRITLKFVISDTGIGIPDDQLSKIFEGFQQADKSTFRKYGGTGLGLNISSQLVEIMGGKIHVESKRGLGTTFSFDLSLGIGNAEMLEGAAILKDNLLIQKLKGLKILLAEDNDFNQIVVVDTIRLLIPQVKIDVANNGHEALEKLNQASYDLILMDVNMPEMDGLEASRAIRIKFGSSVKILAMTASITKEEVDHCFQAGMNDFIPKPFEQDELLQKIAKLTLS